jgi:hypothetical protein
MYVKYSTESISNFGVVIANYLLSHLPFILLSLVTMTDPNPSLLKETRKPSCYHVRQQLLVVVVVVCVQ